MWSIVQPQNVLKQDIGFLELQHGFDQEEALLLWSAIWRTYGSLINRMLKPASNSILNSMIMSAGLTIIEPVEARGVPLLLVRFAVDNSGEGSRYWVREI